MAEDLSPADRSSLAAEQGAVNMAVAALLLFDDGPGLSLAAVRERVAARLHLIPRYRQRIGSLAPGGVTNPVWIDDTGFDLGWHVRRASARDDDELLDLVGQQLSRRLDRSRPLWELTVVDGLDDGRAALIVRMHHALVDGIAAVDLGTVLLDPSPEPMVFTESDEPWAAQPYDRRRHLARLAATPVLRGSKLMRESAQRALGSAADPMRAAADVRRATELVTELARQRPSAPAMALNGPLGPNRRFAIAQAPLATLKALGKSAGGTVNDAILAVVAGALREVLGPTVQSTRVPVALVPVSVRREGEEGGNRISTVLVDLPTDEVHPIARVARLARETRALKDSATVRAGAMLVGASGWAPPLVSGGLARAMGGVRAFNLVVSNVPGPQMPLYMNGCRLRAVHPAVPLNPGNQRLTVGVLSYDGGVYFGLQADRDLDPPLGAFSDALRAALMEAG